MNKKLIRLTEQDLHRIVKQSVRRIIKEDVALPVKEAYENMIQAMEDFEVSVVENMDVQNDDGRYQNLDDALIKAKYAAEDIVNGGFKYPHPNAFK